MNKSKVFSIFIFASIMSIFLVQAVSAQNVFDSLNTILGGDNLSGVYETHGLWIDLIIYIFMFWYVVKFAFRNNQGFAGNSLPAVIGIALAIAATVFEGQSGFRLGHVGPFALGVVVLVIGWVVYQLIQGLGFEGRWRAAAIAYLVVFAFLSTAASPLFEWLEEESEDNEFLALFNGTLHLAAFGSLVALFIGVAAWIKGRLSGLGGGGDDSDGNNRRNAQVAERAARQEQAEQSLIDQLNQERSNIDETLNQIGRLIKLEGTQIQQQEKLLTDLEELLKTLHQTDQQILRLLGQQGGS